MSASTYSLRASLRDSLFQFKRPDVPPWVVVRNSAAVVLPLAAGLLTGHSGVGLGIAAGALDTMFSDQPGPYRQRMQQLLLAALAAGIASLCGFMIGDQLLPLLLACTVIGFCGGLLVVFGPDIARVGMTSMILLVITAYTPMSLPNALLGSALIFSGGLLLTLFSVAAWPLQGYRPERQALAAVYHGLSQMAASHAAGENDAPAVTSALTTLQHTLLGRHHARGRAMEAFGVLLELAERIRLELIAMDELHAHADVYALFRADAARVLNALAAAIDDGQSPQVAERALQTLQASESALFGQTETGSSAAVHVHALSGQLAAAVRNANWAGSQGEDRALAAETPLPAALRSDSAWATLRASLTPDSVAFRHALRCAVCLSLTLLISRLLKLPHGYWLPMTAAIVLRPDFAATFNFGLLRVVGTVMGLLLTTALLHVTPAEPWAHLALMALLCMAFRYLAVAHYGIAVAALTGTVVILLSFEGVSSSTAVMDRLINTALGSGLALLAYVLWPTWEKGRTRHAFADMLKAYAGYLQALAHPDHPDDCREARTAARTARTNAQASLDRLRAEPATSAALVELARSLLDNGNRLARTTMAMEARLGGSEPLPQAEAISRFITHAGMSMDEIASALRERRQTISLPDLRQMQRELASQWTISGARQNAEFLERITDRLVDNVNTLAYIVNRNARQTTTATVSSPSH